MWSKTSLAPLLPGKWSKTIFRTSQPRLDLSTLNLNSSPVKVRTSRLIIPWSLSQFCPPGYPGEPAGPVDMSGNHVVDKTRTSLPQNEATLHRSGGGQNFQIDSGSLEKKHLSETSLKWTVLKISPWFFDPKKKTWIFRCLRFKW